jgi:hypothetical protein
LAEQNLHFQSQLLHKYVLAYTVFEDRHGGLLAGYFLIPEGGSTLAAITT